MTRKEIAALVVITTGIALNLLFQDALATEIGVDWELNQLHNPSPALLDIERSGRVTIYDGVEVAEVDKAMDDQFDRIDSMMFVRVKQPTADGGFYVDSDCD